jgi:SAM-dependent methyltransferase
MNGGNLPWDDPAFSQRMLREHLDESHGAASRTSAERQMQLDWLRDKLSLRGRGLEQEGAELLDVTCGPGLYAVPLAQDGLRVTGVDFGPASIAHARELARSAGVAGACRFVEADVRRFDFGREQYDAALFLYGQLAVFPREEAAQLLRQIADSLRPGGQLVVELLEEERVDKKESSWWFTDERGLWGNAPFLSLGERFWYEEEKLSCERYYTLHLETGKLDEILLCDQTYSRAEMEQMLREAGFQRVSVYPAWDGLGLYDAPEWNVYLAET